MQGLVRFLSYNNAVPIALSFMTLSFGAAFASSEEVRESVYRVEESVVSVDNTYIANKDLSAYAPSVRILEVTEDADNYYVAYELTTIDVVDYVWQDVTKRETMRVAKAVLGNTVDLGLYVTRQLKDVTDSELARLRETQKFEKRAVSQKVVATKYSGLVGQFLDAKTEALPGYQPVVVPPPKREFQTASAAGAQHTNPPQPNTPPSSPPSTPQPPASAAGAPVLEVLGANPAQVPVGALYVDLGVVVHDPPDNNASVYAYLNGNDFPYAVGAISIDTSTDGTWHIRYEATDADGNVGTAERTVIVGNPANTGADEAGATTTPETSPGSEQPSEEMPPAETPAPEPLPEPDPDPEPVPTEPATTTTADPETPPEQGSGTETGGDTEPVDSGSANAGTSTPPTTDNSSVPGTTDTADSENASSTPDTTPDPNPVDEGASDVTDTQATTTQE